MFAYSNNGLNMRCVDASDALDSEVLFSTPASEDELHAAFPGYTKAMASLAQAELAAQAQAILDANDKMALRMWKEGGSWPAVWKAYDEALREVKRGTATVLPIEPTTKPWEA